MTTRERGRKGARGRQNQARGEKGGERTVCVWEYTGAAARTALGEVLLVALVTTIGAGDDVLEIEVHRIDSSNLAGELPG